MLFCLMKVVGWPREALGQGQGFPGPETFHVGRALAFRPLCQHSQRGADDTAASFSFRFGWLLGEVAWGGKGFLIDVLPG